MEIWAFHVSAGIIERNSSDHSSPVTSTSCSGNGSEMPPRAASRCSRSSPISRSSWSTSSAVPSSIAFCTPT